MTRAVLLPGALFVLTGCGEPAPLTQILVRISADEALRAGASELHVATYTEQSSGVWSQRSALELDVDPLRWPVDLPVVRAHGEPSTTRSEIIIELHDSQGVVLAQARNMLSFAPRALTKLSLEIEACGDAQPVCEADAACHGPECSACIAGKCRPALPQTEQPDAGRDEPADSDEPQADGDAGVVPGPDEGLDAGAQCSAEYRCTGRGRQRCQDGVWSDATACSEACLDGLCVNCAPGDARCIKDAVGGVEVCSATGTWQAPESAAEQALSCPLSCSDTSAPVCTTRCLAGRCIHPQTVAAGSYHSCALRESAVHCWGNNASGQLGDSTTVNSSSPVRVGALPPADEVVAGDLHSCARLHTSNVMCWGYNGFGQLGNGGTNPSSTPVDVANLFDVTQLAGGRMHTCAVVGDGTMRCWGSNDSGQLGDGTTSDQGFPARVQGVADVARIGAGDNHTCALLVDGSVRCWGDNRYGQLGNGSTQNSLAPVVVAGVTGARALAVGEFHACAALTNGRVMCWGDNRQGALAGSAVEVTTAVEIVGVRDVRTLGTGDNHSCVLRYGGSVQCWGDNLSSQLGNGTGWPRSDTPVDALKLEKTAELSVGDFHACAVRDDGEVRCWGANDYGQIGAKFQVGSSVPMVVLFPAASAAP